MISPEDYKRQEYKRLIELIGEEKAKKYIHKDYFSPTAIGLTIFFARVKIYVNKSPRKFFFILFCILIVLVVLVYQYFYFW